jgi:hypothetical protein
MNIELMSLKNVGKISRAGKKIVAPGKRLKPLLPLGETDFKSVRSAFSFQKFPQHK